MVTKKVLPFGHWPSPIEAAAVAEGSLRFGKVQQEGEAVYWSEARPLERGRAPIMQWRQRQGVEELLPSPYSARSRVHEYGGGEFLIANHRIFFVNDADQDIYEATTTGVRRDIRRITNLPNTRFADFAFDGRRDRLICVGETHGGSALPDNALWIVPPSGQGAAPAFTGRSFYANPRLNADGGKLAFLAWDLPSMPWDAAALYVAACDEEGVFSEAHYIAGGDGSACFEPCWAEDGSLLFVWDADGWGNLYRWRDGETIEQITTLDAELLKPLWNFHAASYAVLPDGNVYANFVKDGEPRFFLVNVKSGEASPRRNTLTHAATLTASESGATLIGSSDTLSNAIVIDWYATSPEVIRKGSTLAIEEALIARGQALTFPGQFGPVHGFLYRPQNPAVEARSGTRPPLILSLHGGPTGMTPRGQRAAVLYFTSRGFAWLDLNYSGSVGYGRAYRNRLNGRWGVADVADTVSAAEYVIAEEIADASAIFLTGGSAGGYTVLSTVATTNLFRGAASYYGIGDLIALQATTHKFEQGYQSTLLGAALEQDEALYRERSALTHADAIKTPLILFQGADDRVVPKQQSQTIAQAVRARGIRADYHEFEGEGHGFRRAETIRACLEYELSFYVSLLPS